MADIPLLKFLSKKSTFERFRKYIKSHTLLKETEQLLDDIEEYWKMYPSREDVDWDHFAIWHKMVRHPTWEATRYAMYDALFKRIVEYGEVDTTIVDRFIQLDYTAQIRDICDAIIRGDTTNLRGRGSHPRQVHEYHEGIELSIENQKFHPDCSGAVIWWKGASTVVEPAYAIE